MSSVSPRCTVEVPEKQSVHKLKEWLNNFGEQHRQHFEKNQLRPPMGKVGYRIYSIEKRLSASASFDSASTTNDGSSSFTAEVSGAAGDARRGNIVAEPWPRAPSTEGIDRAPSDEMQLSPIHPDRTNQLMPIVGNHGHPAAKDVLSWHPNARKAAGVNQDFGDEFVEDPYEDDDYLDGVSIQTGLYTDPGVTATWSSARASSTSSRVLMVAKAPLPPRLSKDDLAMTTQSRPKSCRIHPKHFLCISTQEESRDEVDLADSASCYRDTPEEVGNTYSTSSDRVALLDACHSSSTIRSAAADNMFSTTWSETSDPSTLAIRPVRVLDTRLSRIFAEETEKMNRQAILNARHGIGHRHPSRFISESTALQDQREAHLSREGNLTPATAIRALSKSAIESRKEELQRKWAENRPPSHVKKVSWHVSNKGGGYKKKVYLDYN